MLLFLKQIINGLAAGSIYAMVALGYTMIYGVLGIINFAQGEIFMAGAFTAVLLLSKTSIGFIPAFFLALVAAAGVGLCMERLAFRPLRGSNPLIPLIAAIGVSIFLQDLARLLFGPDKRDFPMTFKLEPFSLFGADIPAMEIYILITAGLLMAALTVFINKTKYGKAIIASASDSEAARLMGINVDNMIILTFIIGSVLSGAAGVMVSMLYFTHPTMGVLPGLKAFCAAILGGVGNIPGAIIGGILLGIAENLGAAYISSGLKDVFAFAILIVVLIFRPSGIMGKKD